MSVSIIILIATIAGMLLSTVGAYVWCNSRNDSQGLTVVDARFCISVVTAVMLLGMAVLIVWK